MTLRPCRVLWAVPILLLIACSETRKMGAAQASAEGWLALVDQGRYDESWNEASSHFKRRESKADWSARLASERGSSSGPASRRLSVRKFLSRLGNGPEGQYVNLGYHVSFPDRRGFAELMTMVVDDDGAWRVYGYMIVGAGPRPASE